MELMVNCWVEVGLCCIDVSFRFPKLSTKRQSAAPAIYGVFKLANRKV